VLSSSHQKREQVFLVKFSQLKLFLQPEARLHDVSFGIQLKLRAFLKISKKKWRQGPYWDVFLYCSHWGARKLRGC
jgi:hypothetical protein